MAEAYRIRIRDWNNVATEVTASHIETSHGFAGRWQFTSTWSESRWTVRDYEAVALPGYRIELDIDDSGVWRRLHTSYIVDVRRRAGISTLTSVTPERFLEQSDDEEWTYESQPVHTAIDNIFRSSTSPGVGQLPHVIQTGIEVAPVFTTNGSAMAQIERAALVERGRFYVDETGTCVFLNQANGWGGTASTIPAHQFTSREVSSIMFTRFEGYKNRVVVGYRPYYLSASQQVIWSAEVPQFFEQGTHQISVVPETPGGIANSFKWLVTMQPNTHYTFNALEDGTGADHTPLNSMAWRNSRGEKLLLDINIGSGIGSWLTFAEVRGRPFSIGSRQEIKYDHYSIEWGLQAQEYQVDTMTNKQATELGTMMIARLSSEHNRESVSSIGFDNRHPRWDDAISAAKVMQQIEVDNNRYYIRKVEHDISKYRAHSVTLYLEPIEAGI